MLTVVYEKVVFLDLADRAALDFRKRWQEAARDGNSVVEVHLRR